MKMAARKSKRIRKTVRLSVEVGIEFDASIMPDDDWRTHFYGDIKTHDDLAEWFAKLYCSGGPENLNRIDGFADRENDQASFRISEIEVDDISDTRD